MASPCAKPLNHLGSIHPGIRIGSPMPDGTEWEMGQGDLHDAFESIKRQWSHLFTSMPWSIYRACSVISSKQRIRANLLSLCATSNYGLNNVFLHFLLAVMRARQVIALCVRQSPMVAPHTNGAVKVTDAGMGSSCLLRPEPAPERSRRN